MPLWVPTLVLFGVNGFFWCCVYDREQNRFLRQKLVGMKTEDERSLSAAPEGSATAAVYIQFTKFFGSVDQQWITEKN